MYRGSKHSYKYAYQMKLTSTNYKFVDGNFFYSTIDLSMKKNFVDFVGVLNILKPRRNSGKDIFQQQSY